MKIITLCGSSKFKKTFRILEIMFTLKGYLVISMNIFFHYDNIQITVKKKEMLDNIHKRKIELADIVYIVNKNKYIGLSTKNEIDYAIKLNKEIEYFEKYE